MKYTSFYWARSFSEGLAMVVVDKYCTAGYIDKNGQWVIEPKFYGTIRDYDSCRLFLDERFFPDAIEAKVDRGDFSQGLASIGLLEGSRLKSIYINRLGNIVIKDVYGGSFHDGLAWYSEAGTGKYGYIDMQGRTIIPLCFLGATHFSKGIASVWLDKKTPFPAFIDKRGNILFNNNQYDLLYIWGGFYDDPDLALVKAYNKRTGNKEMGYIDRQGNFRKPGVNHYFCNSAFSDGLAFASSDDCDGNGFYFDKNMNIVYKRRLRFYTRFSEGKAAVIDYNTRESGYIDKSGTMIFKFKFDRAAPFSDGMAAFELNKKIGYIDSTGDIVIPPQFDSARHFSEGFAAICKAGKWNYIDKSGRIVF